MKNWMTWIVIAVILTVCGMVGVHWEQTQLFQKKVEQIQVLSERQSMLGKMIVDLEKYRRMSKDFRKMSQAEINSLKEHLKTEIQGGMSTLEKLNSSPEEKSIGLQIVQQLSDFMVLSAELEPRLFLKDVYSKEEPRKIHDAIVSELVHLEENAKNRQQDIPLQIAVRAKQSYHMLALGVVVMAFLMMMMIFRNFWIHARPLRKLGLRAGELHKGNLSPNKAFKWRGEFARIEAVLHDLASTVIRQRNERNQFINSVAKDLRTPIVGLQAAGNLLASTDARIDAQQRNQAASAVKRSIFKITKALDDLTELSEMNTVDKKEIRLDERIIDLRDVITQVAQMMGGDGAPHAISASVPPVPVWALIDSGRFERVLISLVSKMARYLPQGGRIDISLNKVSTGSFRGLEVIIRDDERMQAGRKTAGGPEMDVLKHWVNENGFGIALAQAVVQAHGGTISASGIAGTGVLFTIRIPQERVASGLISGMGNAASESAVAQSPLAAPAVPAGAAASETEAGSAAASSFELTRIKPVLPEQAINFGS